MQRKYGNEWNGDIFFSHGTTNSCGVAILISPGLDLDIQVTQKDNNGRFLALKIQTDDNNDFALYNIYAPVRSQVQDQLSFLDFIKDVHTNNECLYTIMGGDFNTIFNPSVDKQGGDMSGCTNTYTDELVAFMEAHDLIDAIRYSNQDKKIFTRVQRTPPVLSRIDHWIISTHLINYLQTATAFPGIKSDHSIIFIHLTHSLVKRGRGFWKFNSLLLQDLEYVNTVSNFINNLKEETQYMIDKQLRWDYIKAEIRGFTLQYSSKKNKAKKEFKLKLEKDLYDVENDIHSCMTPSKVDIYKFIKEELEKIEELETKGAILRSKIRWAEAGEKNTKYFLNLERKNAIEKHICKIQTASGNIVSDPKQILIEQKRFYEKLYSDPNCQENGGQPIIGSSIFIESLPQLSQEQSNMCEGLITESECASALKR